jgi:murein DD-endopeptidase MepM/ murein hydrolase activator NlpD
MLKNNEMLATAFRTVIISLMLILLLSHIFCTTVGPVKFKGYYGVYHVVKPQQTLYRICLTYKVPVDIVSRLNRISDSSQISVGQKIFIPGASRVLMVKVINSSSSSPTRTSGNHSYSNLPANGTINSKFGWRNGRQHTGVDIGNSFNTPVRAIMKGIVTFAGRMSDYGLVVIIEHPNGWLTYYAHNAENLVRKGQYVRENYVVAKMGNSGNATGVHVHFELRINGNPVDPLKHLK